MNTAIHTDTIERDGYTFRVEHFHDNDADAPWHDDGHGPVIASNKKHAGYLLLSGCHYYDYAEACRIARRDDWGSYSADCGMTRREFAAQQAHDDYENLRAWCAGEWSYIGVVVTLLDVEGNETDATDSLWRVDDNGDYAATVASDCVDNILSQITDNLRFDDSGATYARGARSWIVQGEVNA